MDIYIQRNDTLPLDAQGRPMLMTDLQHNSQCCCACPCYRWIDNEVEMPCCGVVEAYSVSSFDWANLAGSRYRFIGNITMTPFLRFNRRCTWFGSGGVVEFYSPSDAVWKSLGTAAAFVFFAGGSFRFNNCGWRIRVGELDRVPQEGDDIPQIITTLFLGELFVEPQGPVAPPIGDYSYVQPTDLQPGDSGGTGTATVS